MKEIEIYSPVDGEIKELVELNDGAFSKGMLGSGFYIEPSSNVFYSPIKKGELVEIFHTKHAFFFKEEQGGTILMHIGLDTVKLEGKPFKILGKKNQKVSLESKIVQVDFNVIEKEQIAKSTPIVLDTGENAGWTFEFNKKGKVKTGDLVGKFKHNETQETESSNLEAYFGASGKYASAALELNELVGGKNNYTEVYNCMTRLRFKIIDKNLVQEKNIASISMVKGLIWNGDELQIIIGQDVYKVKDEIIKFQKSVANAKVKKPFMKSALAMFSGIMVPLIPIFIGTGLIQALIGILTLTNIMPAFQMTEEGMQMIKNAQGWDIFWLMLFVVGKSAPLFNGIAVAVSASKFFGLRTFVGVGIGIIIASPLLFLGGGAFGAGGEWILFTLGKINVSDLQLQYILDRWLTIMITAGNLKIFVIIAVIYFAKIIDEWVKSWISPLFELTCRTTIVFLIAGMTGFCLFMPLWNFFEGILAIIMYFISKLPLGLGLGAYTGLWQVFVIFGIHGTVGLIAALQTLVSMTSGQGGYGIFAPGQSISVYAQIGAIIGLAIITKNRETRNQSLQLVPLGFLGITEPIIYGLTLPRKKLFISSILAAFIAGTFAGIIGVTSRLGTGVGVFEAIGYFQYTPLDPTGQIAEATGQLSWIANGLWYLAACMVALGSGVILSILMYSEKISEKKQLDKLNKKLFSFINKNSILTQEEKVAIIDKLKTELNVFNEEEQAKEKEAEKRIIEFLKVKARLSVLEDKQSKLKTKLNKYGKKAVEKAELEKAENIKQKIETSKFKVQIQDISKAYEELEKQLNLSELKSISDKKLKHISKSLKNSQVFDKDELDKIAYSYEEALNSVLITYNYLDKFEADKKFKF
ncbi:PTS glucose transporter subunit IIABC [Mesoplasma florum]|uniref:PTS glucose transporter subunit IIABC n=1 Tax=Mesoplasma florum TaxID=2151 RepID=UPI00131A4420|nr:PTS glucose transporter subunit IIABC [Mesoplasma florum]